MKIRLVAAIFALVATPALGLAQQGGPAPNGPKPTKADVQKIVQIITSDKAKTQAYCDLNKLYDQMGAAEQKNDSKTAQALDQQADALVGKLGPEYSKVMGGLMQVDPNSNEGKEFMSMLSGLHKLCTGPALALPAQPAPNTVASCAQITAACKQAGFVPNGAKNGCRNHSRLRPANYGGNATTGAGR
jgi:hypothetical protein